MERPLRLISSNPVDQLARTVEALLVVASQPLVGRGAVRGRGRRRRAGRDGARAALGAVSRGPQRHRPRARRRRLGVPRRARGGRGVRRACSSGRSSAASRRRRSRRWRSSPTSARCSRPEIARIRGVASRLGRRGPRRARPDRRVGPRRRRRRDPLPRDAALRARLRPREPRALPRLDDLGEDAAAIRERLEAVAGKRAG